jgi:hypothetical protein
MTQIQGGYYIKARCIVKKPIGHAPPHIREVWDYLLREANHKSVLVGLHTIKRGQLLRSYDQIAEDLCWFVGWRKERYSVDQMKASMRYLRKHLMITTQRTPRKTLISVINYDTYQDPKNYENTREATKDKPKETPTRTPPYNKNEKNVKNEKNDKNERAEPAPPPSQNKPPSRLKAYLASVRCSEKFVESIFKKYSLAEIKEAANILRKQKAVDNSEAFLNHALSLKWKATNGRSLERNKNKSNGHNGTSSDNSHVNNNFQPKKGECLSKNEYIEGVKQSEFYRRMKSGEQVEYLKFVSESYQKEALEVC